MINNQKIFVIAEAGVNHNGNLSIAKKLIQAAKDCGADAIKFQNFTANKLTTKSAKKAPYQIKNTKERDSQFDMLRKLELKIDDYYKLLNLCKLKKIKFLSSVFDPESIDFLHKRLKINLIKIPSGEITNYLILHKINLRKYKIILSTGMSNLEEVASAINLIAKKKIYTFNKKKLIIKNTKFLNEIKKKLIIMHCVTDYPVNDKFANLKCIDSMKKKLKLTVGYSDHTKGIIAPLIAVSKGAKVIEKHFTLNRNMKGPDHAASLNPSEFKKMVNNIRIYEKMLGFGVKKLFACEKVNIKIARKSLVALKNIKKGEIFTEKNITTKRPGNGICASKFKNYLKKKSTRDYKIDELIK